MNWFYCAGNAQQGPVDDTTFRALAANGTIRPNSLVWHDGMPNWQPLSAAVPGLVPGSVPPPLPAVPAANGISGAPIPPGTVPNHLVGAVLVTVCCCMPFGVVSILYAAKVNGLLAAGKLKDAQDASQNANTWMWVAFGVGIVSNLIGILFSLLPILAEMD